MVIDAGFDYFIRENWQDLLASKQLKFYFLAPVRQSLVKLRMQQKPCSYGSDTHVCFSINPANWIVRLLLDPIELGYDRHTQQLSRYRGLANISDADGNGFRVDIHYSYSPLCLIDNNCTASNTSRF